MSDFSAQTPGERVRIRRVAVACWELEISGEFWLKLATRSVETATRSVETANVWPRMLAIAIHLTQRVAGDSGTEGEGAWR